ncbi:Spherulation-specific family 4 [Mycena capillaripes]|nr:Spherulation-specific family 4 [Mycena capillaripes]
MFALLFFAALALRPVVALLSNGVIFPLYIYPDLVFNDGCAAWTPVFTAITANPTLPFLIVINPASGPGSANTQPDTNYQSCIASLNSHANVRVLGYVATGFGGRSSSDVTTDIATYGQWGTAYRPTGIFFDETEATTQFVSLYQSYATSVMFNPGVAPVPAFYTFADLVVSIENFYSSFSVSQLVISPAAPAHKQSVLLHDGPSTTPVTLVNQLSEQLGIGYIFITDAEYTSIPSDWANFCNDVRGVAWRSKTLDAKPVNDIHLSDD